MISKTNKTTAIVLRTIPVTNTSAIVVWLSRDHGRLATIIKGAYRPKSMFLGRFDLFYTCELVYYRYAREHLHTARECSPLKWRVPLRTDWRACAAASYFCDLLEKVTPWGAPHPELFKLLDDKLDELASHGMEAESVFWFELRLMELLGLTPRLDSCVACGVKMAATGNREIFSDEHGGLVCSRCHGAGRHTEFPVSPAALAMLRRWQGCPDARMAQRTHCSARQKKEIAGLLGRFLRYQLENALESRSVAFQIFADSTSQ